MTNPNSAKGCCKVKNSKHPKKIGSGWVGPGPFLDRKYKIRKPIKSTKIVSRIGLKKGVGGWDEFYPILFWMSGFFINFLRPLTVAVCLCPSSIFVVQN